MMMLIQFLDQAEKLLPEFNLQVNITRCRGGKQLAVDFTVFCPPNEFWHASNLGDLLWQILATKGQTENETTVAEVSAMLAEAG